MNNISFKQYRAIDLCIWVVILLIFEFVTATAAARWFPEELYTLSQTTAVLCIVMMRWGGYAVLHAVAGGAAFCLASGGSAEQFAVYCIGNCFALAALALFKAADKEKVRSKAYLTAIFTLIAFCGAQLGRWLVSLVFGAPLNSLIMFFATDSLTLLYSVVVVLVARRVDGLYEDQKSYLVRTESERKRHDEEF